MTSEKSSLGRGPWLLIAVISGIFLLFLGYVVFRILKVETIQTLEKKEAPPARATP